MGSMIHELMEALSGAIVCPLKIDEDKDWNETLSKFLVWNVQLKVWWPTWNLPKSLGIDTAVYPTRKGTTGYMLCNSWNVYLFDFDSPQSLICHLWRIGLLEAINY